MTKYLEVSGKTEQAAIDAALAQLGLDRDDVSVEILDRAKTGFLGIGSSPARIRVTYEAPDETPEPAPSPAEPPAGEEKTVYQAPKAERTPRADKPPKAADKPPKAKPQPKPVLEPEPTQPVDDDASQAIVAFLTGLFQHMEMTCQITVELSQRGAYEVRLEGEELGRIIGRRGDTLDAIQQLTGYAINRGRKERVRVHLDAEGYRARREESLANLARRTAEKAIRLQRSITLEPMNAYERHVVHTALQGYPHISTHSVGTDPNRRTVVCYEADEDGSDWGEEE